MNLLIKTILTQFEVMYLSDPWTWSQKITVSLTDLIKRLPSSCHWRIEIVSDKTLHRKEGCFSDRGVPEYSQIITAAVHEMVTVWMLTLNINWEFSLLSKPLGSKSIILSLSQQFSICNRETTLLGYFICFNSGNTVRSPIIITIMSYIKVSPLFNKLILLIWQQQMNFHDWYSPAKRTTKHH